MQPSHLFRCPKQKDRPHISGQVGHLFLVPKFFTKDKPFRNEAERDYRDALQRGLKVQYLETKDLRRAQRYLASGVPEF